MPSAAPLIETRVCAKTAAARDICVLELESAGEVPLPPYEPGAHIDVHAMGYVRQYSLCGDPTRPGRYRIAVLRSRQSRGGSAAIHDHVAPGQALTIGAPRNHFPLAADAPFSLLLAGGIGITPLFGMAMQLAAASRPFALHYCARSPAHAAFREELARLGRAASLRFHYDDGGPAQRLDLPAVLRQAPAGAHLYVCGPQGFMDHVLEGAGRAGWPPRQLHSERFSATPESAPGGAFEIVAARSGARILVAPGESAVQALDRAGIAVPVSCGQGICGTCLTAVLAGTPDHRDMFLTPEERARNDCFLPCCSRASSLGLTLDL